MKNKYDNEIIAPKFFLQVSLFGGNIYDVSLNLDIGTYGVILKLRSSTRGGRGVAKTYENLRWGVGVTRKTYVVFSCERLVKFVKKYFENRKN